MLTLCDNERSWHSTLTCAWYVHQNSRLKTHMSTQYDLSCTIFTSVVWFLVINQKWIANRTTNTRWVESYGIKMEQSFKFRFLFVIAVTISSGMTSYNDKFKGIYFRLTLGKVGENQGVRSYSCQSRKCHCPWVLFKIHSSFEMWVELLFNLQNIDHCLESVWKTAPVSWYIQLRNGL